MISHLAASARTPDLAFISQQLFTAILWIDESLHIKWVNAQAEQLLAISYSRLLEQSVLNLLAPKELNNKCTKTDHLSTDSLTERFCQAQQYQQPFITHDHTIKRSSNPSAPLLIDYSVTPVTYESESYFIVEMWGKDRQSRITDEQRQQQQYSVARQMLRSVAHEVKNPLAGIRGAAQLLERQFNKLNEQTLKQKLQTYSDVIINETDRLTDLIGQLLGSNQLANWQKLNIHQPLEHVLTLMLSQYPNITLHRDYDLSLPELEADRDQLIQLFLNLVNNACESMTEYEEQLSLADQRQAYYPKLSIQTRVAFQHTIGHQQHKQVLQISITDNGSGIDPAFIEQIFFPMVTSRAAGTGLGLAIVQDIVSRHHGMIEVSSALDEDDNQTSFVLYLPFAQPLDRQ
ncbi:nitrogen regulation protein NR(II) [Psychrobacter sp. AH5]|uniref:nitrogen regulation protein NR(II) n=1 Tax=Psychrobacter sp. AH5 TaxID=2937433 RepID=UPI00334238F7